MNIGKHFGFGIRKHGKKWYKYIIPHAIMPKNHEYFKYFYWWLWFYFCKQRKCEKCGQYVESNGGYREWVNGDYVKRVICRQCAREDGIAPSWY